MRLLTLLTLSLLALAPLRSADATTTRQQQAGSRPAATAPNSQARSATRATPPRSATRQTPRRQTASTRATTGRTQATTQGRNRTAAARTSGRNGAAASCQRRDSRGRCVGPRTASLQGAAGWQGGLPAASNTQSDCPSGTMATLARGHSDVTRCMPI
ncbi:hypothetical protein ACQW02_22290 [Humitalea sp. 24SJ18S-53]|uniref:hypothetical protein n=1 Tax=Humitalea sp. 24SJ18S-53 TaxID=3422307 RepID=UPI003D666871